MDRFLFLLFITASGRVFGAETTDETVPEADRGDTAGECTSSECTSAGAAALDPKVFNVISEYAIASILYSSIRTPSN